MEHYYPQADNNFEASYIISTFLLIALFSAIGESLFLAIADTTKISWLKNPWIFSIFLVVFFSIFSYFSWLESNHLLWIDAATWPLSIILYVIYRQLFQGIFTTKSMIST